MNPRDILFGFSRLAGLPGIVGRSRWRRARALILCYHGVSLRDEHLADPELYVTPAFLRERFARLAATGCVVLRLADAVERLASGSLPPRSVVLTFDDGTRDFAKHVVPLLAEFGFPATVYVTTYYCEHALPVFDTALSYILWRGRGSSVDLRGIAGTEESLLLTSPRRREASRRAIYDAAERQGYSAEQKHQVLRETAERLALDFADIVASGMFQQMTPAEIGALPRDLVDVQLHTHRHRVPRDRVLFLKEIEENRQSLQRHSGGLTFEHFCYPSGEYLGEFLGWLRASGVRTATTCVPGLASTSDDPLLLPRFVDTSLTSEAAFDAWTSGLAAFVPRHSRYRLDPERLKPSPAG